MAGLSLAPLQREIAPRPSARGSGSHELIDSEPRLVVGGGNDALAINLTAHSCLQRLKRLEMLFTLS